MTMMKAFLKFTGYILLKWLCFYIYQVVESKRDWDWNRMQSREDIFYTAWMLLALPILEILILVLPFQLALKQRGWLVIAILLLAFVLEFIIGWFATNQRLEVWMIVKIILSMALFFLMYRKQLDLLPKVTS
jgi:hypothetical protein